MDMLDSLLHGHHVQEDGLRRSAGLRCWRARLPRENKSDLALLRKFARSDLPTEPEFIFDRSSRSWAEHQDRTEWIMGFSRYRARSGSVYSWPDNRFWEEEFVQIEFSYTTSVPTSSPSERLHSHRRISVWSNAIKLLSTTRSCPECGDNRNLRRRTQVDFDTDSSINQGPDGFTSTDLAHLPFRSLVSCPAGPGDRAIGPPPQLHSIRSRHPAAGTVGLLHPGGDRGKATVS